MGELNRSVTLEGSESGFATTKLDALLNWSRKYSLFICPPSAIGKCCPPECS